MNFTDAPETAKSMLDALADPDDLRFEHGYRLFCDRYLEYVFEMFQRNQFGGIRRSDADDAAQEFFVKLRTKLRKFRKDSSRGRFRDWLRTVAVNFARDFAESERLRRGLPISLDSYVPAIEELTSRILTNLELSDLLDPAECLAKQRCSPGDWLVYERYRQGHSSTEIADDFGASKTSINQATYRVRKHIRRAARQLAIEWDAEELITW